MRLKRSLKSMIATSELWTNERWVWTGRCRQDPLILRTLAVSSCEGAACFATTLRTFMAAIGRFQKGEEIFYAKVVDGELFRLRGDVFGSPSFDKKATSFK